MMKGSTAYPPCGDAEQNGMRVCIDWYGVSSIACLVTTVSSAWYVYDSSKMDFDNHKTFLIPSENVLIEMYN